MKRSRTLIVLESSIRAIHVIVDGGIKMLVAIHQPVGGSIEAARRADEQNLEDGEDQSGDILLFGYARIWD